MEICLDFNYDDDVVDLYKQSLEHEYTNEFRINPRTFTREQVANRLYDISKTKAKNGLDLHGILKAYIDNNLVAICFPREILPHEYDTFSLKPINNYNRLSGIFVNPEYRGQGIAYEIAKWFVDKYKFILWTADVNNNSSIKVAQKLNLTEIKENDIIGSNENVLYTVKVFSN